MAERRPGGRGLEGDDHVETRAGDVERPPAQDGHHHAQDPGRRRRRGGGCR